MELVRKLAEETEAAQRCRDATFKFLVDKVSTLAPCLTGLVGHELVGLLLSYSNNLANLARNDNSEIVENRYVFFSFFFPGFLICCTFGLFSFLLLLNFFL